jgi:uncharacterized repeat protein (TIGR03803 family)
VFKLSPNGTETVLHTFTGGSDGANPNGALIADTAGNLYGNTTYGGDGGSCSHFGGCGVVFKLSPDGTETVLHTFTGGSDGANPIAGLIADRAGNLYGTTFFGGGRGSCYRGCGVVFKLSPDGAETVLHTFTGGSDGSSPEAPLIADSAGNLYGTTDYGGGICSGPFAGCGVVFKLSPDGVETVLHTFTGGRDGADPSAGLIADRAGNLYGTTFFGGGRGSCYGGTGCGVVFKLSPDGAETMLHTFTGGSDGASPSVGLGLIADTAGNLYGTTTSGGVGANGVVFKLSGTGFVTTVPFSAFQAALEVEFGRKPNADAFELISGFTLGQGSNGINPIAEPVTIQVGTFTTTIPPGSFKATGVGFHFEGAVNGVALEVGITPARPSFGESTSSPRPEQYMFTAEAHKANLSGTANPVTVAITIGDDTGTRSVDARFSH